MIASDLRTLGIIVALLLISGLFSGAEISFLALSRRGVRQVREGRLGAVIERLLDHPGAVLGTILVTITASNYAAEATAASWVLTRSGLPVAVALVGVAVLVIVFAEVVPITYAAANPERVAGVAAVPLLLASALLALPARVVGFAAECLARLLGAAPGPESPVTEGEILALVDMQVETGALEEEEKVMIRHIFEFGDKVAREVMVPRTDIIAISERETVSTAGKLATEHHVSRLPVYRGDLDHIVGVLHVKDVLPLLASGQRDVPVTSVMQRAFTVPETRTLRDLLEDLRRRRRTMAVVIDEYGGTAGLVTLEDLLEEVVGDIYDEYDVVKPAVERLADGSLAVDGRLGIGEASAAIGVALPEGEYDSLAGFLYSRLGTVPAVGDGVDIGGLHLSVLEVDGHRITRVKVARTSRAEPTDGMAAGTGRSEGDDG